MMSAPTPSPMVLPSQPSPPPMFGSQQPGQKPKAKASQPTFLGSGLTAQRSQMSSPSLLGGDLAA